MAIHYSAKMKMPFDQAVEKVTQSLQKQGFGIITTIDLKNTFKEKLKADFRNYRILGACNPAFAFKAVSLDSHLGVMLPCNVIVQEHENGEIEVSAVNPAETLDQKTHPDIGELAEEVSNRLREAVDELHMESQKV